MLLVSYFGFLLMHFLSQIALVKMHCTKTAQETAEDAVQIFGGRGITTTGMGRLAEHVRPPSGLFVSFLYSLINLGVFSITGLSHLMLFLVEVRVRRFRMSPAFAD